MASKSFLAPLVACSLLLLLILPLLFRLPPDVLPLFSVMQRQGSGGLACNQIELGGVRDGLDPIGATDEDVRWVKAQLQRNKVGEAPKTAEEWRQLRKGINPRTRQQQLDDLLKYVGRGNAVGLLNYLMFHVGTCYLVTFYWTVFGHTYADQKDHNARRCLSWFL
eukprot:c22803_g1_i2 orf=24-518(+)